MDRHDFLLKYIKSISLILIIIFILFGVSIASAENISYSDAFYVSGSSMITLGPGDLAAKTKAGKAVTGFFAITGSATFFLLITLTGNYLTERVLRPVSDLENVK